MKLLLTSDGISNTSIHNALVKLLGKPIATSSALCIPTGVYPFPDGAAMAAGFIRGVVHSPMCELGWKALGVLELTALPSITKGAWVPLVQETDACWFLAAIPSICATGCGTPDWQTSCPLCGARWSMWG